MTVPLGTLFPSPLNTTIPSFVTTKPLYTSHGELASIKELVTLINGWYFSGISFTIIDWFTPLSPTVIEPYKLTRPVSSIFIYKVLPQLLSKSVIRSEEHTSELQSRFDLVCRLL